MSISLRCPPSQALPSFSFQVSCNVQCILNWMVDIFIQIQLVNWVVWIDLQGRNSRLISTASGVHFNFRSSFPHIRASSSSAFSSSSSSLDAGHLSLTLLSVVQNFNDPHLFYYLIGSSEKKKNQMKDWVRSWMLCLALAKSFLTLLFSMILRGIKF